MTKYRLTVYTDVGDARTMQARLFLWLEPEWLEIVKAGLLHVYRATTVWSEPLELIACAVMECEAEAAIGSPYCPAHREQVTP